MKGAERSSVESGLRRTCSVWLGEELWEEVNLHRDCFSHRPSLVSRHRSRARTRQLQTRDPRAVESVLEPTPPPPPSNRIARRPKLSDRSPPSLHSTQATHAAAAQAHDESPRCRRDQRPRQQRRLGRHHPRHAEPSHSTSPSPPLVAPRCQATHLVRVRHGRVSTGYVPPPKQEREQHPPLPPDRSPPSAHQEETPVVVVNNDGQGAPRSRIDARPTLGTRTASGLSTPDPDATSRESVFVLLDCAE